MMQSDQDERRRALDTSKSFIVQAPAGSGKTELLIQRFLKLLSSGVRQPEDVIAITFTKKAASEMRERINHALLSATGPCPTETHKQETWMIAKAVLEHDKKHSWHLIKNPNRIRTLTIDALCAQITGQTPWLSRFGDKPDIISDPRVVYVNAAKKLLRDMEQNESFAPAAMALLRYLNNDFDKVVELMAHMLSHRDQWLPHIVSTRQARDYDAHQTRLHLEHSLSLIIESHLKQLGSFFSCDEQTALLSLAKFSYEQKIANELSNEAFTVADWPGSTANDLNAWLSLANLCLTNDGQWRKRLTISEGFPAATKGNTAAEKALFKHKKAEMAELLDCFREAKDPELLQLVRKLPRPAYTDEQWQILESIFDLLPLACAYLKVEFAVRRAVDFIEISDAALNVLTCDDMPSDTLLKLDNRIQHILVDEVQDISISQGRLLHALTSGWEQNDGRTLFLVGDPMQSIYRFRQAEVSLFVDMQNQQRLGQVHLNPIYLKMNFRSNKAIIDWVNSTFTSVFPPKSNLMLGAIQYTPSVAANAEMSNAVGVFRHLLADGGAFDSADVVIDLIKKEKQLNPDGSIAILVRARSHLPAVIQLLRSHHIVFQAVEIEALVSQPIIGDLLSLYRALNHFADDIAWLSLLRAPWCGLPLTDLHLLMDVDAPTVWLKIEASVSNNHLLSEHGRVLLGRFYQVICHVLAERQRLSMRDFIYKTWLMLGGPACLSSVDERQYARRFFELVDEVHQAVTPDINELETALERLYATNTESASGLVQVMTIHKSKGLEFDCVILPELHKQPVKGDKKLFAWSEFSVDEESCLSLAPIKAAQSSNEPIYEYLELEEKRKLTHEAKRLFYVACTRAKQKLLLVASVRLNDEGELVAPNRGSFLGFLAEAETLSHKDFIFPQGESAFEQAEGHEQKQYKRLPDDFSVYTYISEKLPSISNNDNIYFYDDFAATQQSYAKQASGTFIHRILAQIHDDGVETWHAKSHNDLSHSWRQALTRQNLSTDVVEATLNDLDTVLEYLKSDTCANWILNNQHDDSHAEYPVSMLCGDIVEHYVIDRTFIDDGVRWIIDYKTAAPNQDEPLKEFVLNQKKQYMKQLQSYAKFFAEDSHPIKLGLYFPLIDVFECWSYGGKIAE